MLLKKIFEEITFLGGIVFYGMFLIWFLLTKDYFFFFFLLLGLVLIYAITLIIRSFYFKSRPIKVKHNNFIEKIDASSFPSIHSARIIFLFIFSIIYFIKDFLFIFLFFVLTLSVIYSRFYLKRHHLSDLIGGIVLGILSFSFSYLVLS